MSHKNWILLNRKIQQNVLWQDDEPFDRRSAWIDLLLLANHSDHVAIINKQFIPVKRGDVNRSILQLAHRWHWSRNKTMRFLETLKRASMVTVKSTTQGTTITIENYNKYQFTPTTESATESATHDTTQGTTQGTTCGTHTNNIKEIIKTNKEREIRIPTNAEKVGMSVKDFVRAKARGEI